VNTYGGHESLDELRRVGDEEVVVLEDGEDGHDGVLADVGVTVFLYERGWRGWQEGL
jgi:hypothetical protein